MEVRDTKRGSEELTYDIPNVSPEAIRNLDTNGLVRVGTEIKEGDILIGKITPKGEKDPTPEEKLLRAIFGEKAGDVKDASMKAPPGVSGVVIDKKLFSRYVKDKKQKVKEKSVLDILENEFEQQNTELRRRMIEKILLITEGQTSLDIANNLRQEIIPKGSKFTAKLLANIDFININPTNWTKDNKVNEQIQRLFHNYEIKYKEILGIYQRKKLVAQVGDELPAGIIQLAKVYVAKKRKLRVGDKMAGRHGNKGIVARIVRDEDMPYMEDGTPVDIVLNPLGVPSRMNLGQIYGTVLGWAGKKLGLKFSTPIFDGATIEQINEYMDKANLPHNGKVYLRDGGTGERFDQPATVGIIYMLKLHHLVDDKMHARSIGPYSLITQQPLGGKAQFEVNVSGKWKFGH